MSDGLKVSESKPQKEKLIDAWAQTIASNAVLLESIGCKEVTEYAREAWHINHIRECIKWFNTVLYPKIAEFNNELSRFTPDQWRMIAINTPSDLRDLNSRKRIVMVTWNKRPRFKDEIKRWEQGF